ncbi:unnamed protein product, partial [Prorocentrum cordatum]
DEANVLFILSRCSLCRQVSHDGRWVVLASDPLRLVGVDVAAPQRWRGDAEDDSWMEDLFELLSDSERSRVRREDSVRGRYGVFQRLWSAKEAVTKAIGRGLDFSIERIEVALDGEVQSAWPSWAQRGACRSGDRVAARSALGPRCTQDFGGAPHGPEGTPREA